MDRMSILIRVLTNAAALWAATRLVPGVTFTGDWWLILGVGVVFGLLNLLVRPVLKLLTFPLLLLSLGLFTFVLNAVMLWLTSLASDALDLGFHVDGFTAAFLGALVVSVVSLAMSAVVWVGRLGSRDADD